MADIGLYTLKVPFGKLIRGLLPLLRNVHPNAISLLVVPIGAVTAYCFWRAPDGWGWVLAGGLLLPLRMVVATIDGMVAVHFGKTSPEGELVNRMAPELADIMLLAGIVLARSDYHDLIVPVLAVAWATSFFGLIGLVARRPIQSVGPVGQTDRIAALGLFCIAELVRRGMGADVDLLKVFLWWTIVGGTLTCVLRCVRTMRAESAPLGAAVVGPPVTAASPQA
jgi:phosphatidylglycerophosphate synthase